MTMALAALESDLQYVGKVDEEIEEAFRLLAMHVYGKSGFTSYAHPYHPSLRWRTVGSERAMVLAHIASQVFSLSPSPAGVERSFKVRNRVHCKTRVQLSDDKEDKHSAVIYNSTQLKCMDSGVLGTKRDNSVETFPIFDYKKFVLTLKSALAK